MNCISHTGRMPMCAAPAAAPTIAGLADRRVDDPLGAEPVEQPVGHLEGAAVRADVLAEAEDARVALHLLEQALADGLEVGDLSHRASPSSPGARARSTALPDALAVPERRHRRRVGVDADQRSRAARAAATARRRRWRRRSPPHPRIDRLELGGADALAAGQPLHVAVERIVLARPALDLAGGHVALVVVLGVALPAVGHQLDQRDAFAAAGRGPPRPGSPGRPRARRCRRPGRRGCRSPPPCRPAARRRICFDVGVE